MQKNVKYAVAAVTLIVVAVVIWKIVKGSEDEGPIIVKNGSITIETDGEWREDGGSWSNEPGKGKGHRGDLWVRVNLTNDNPCRGSGRPVHIEYSAGGFQANFNVVGNPPRTKVSPKGQLNRESNQLLRHGSQNDGGYITGVKINGTTLTCPITQTNLEAIYICSSADASACQ